MATDGLAHQVRGRKEILLFPPEDLPLLEYRARPKGVMRYEYPDRFTRVPLSAEARATKVLFAASINMTHPCDRQTQSRCDRDTR